MLRIIAGKYKNKRLKAPDEVTRPTKDMVKEALFSSLGTLRSDQSLLDLFAGSGAIGIEAISRGIGRVVLNDGDFKAYRAILENIKGIDEDIVVFNYDYGVMLKRLREAFDLVFLDPPYEFNEYDEILKIIKERSLLKKGGMIIVEVRKGTDLCQNNDHYSVYKHKTYGISELYYLKEREDV